MKTFKNSWLRASVMLLLVTGIFLTLNAMKKASPVAISENQPLETWYFTRLIDDNPANPLNYSSDSNDEIPCHGNAQIVCQILVPNTQGNDLDLNAMSSYGDQTILQRIQAAHSIFSTNETVISFRSK